MVITFHELSEFAPKEIVFLNDLILYTNRFSTWSHDEISMETRPRQ